MTSTDLDTVDLESSVHSEAEARLVGLSVLLHPELSRVGEVAPLFTARAGGRAVLSRLEPSFTQPGATASEPLSNPSLSRQPLTIRTDGRGHCIIESSASLRCRVDGIPLKAAVDVPLERLGAGIEIELADCVLMLLHFVSPATTGGERLGLLGESLAIQRLRTAITQVADSSTSVLIRGESGSGKELVARAIHELSPRRMRPFVAVNAAAVPKTMAAAALFGHTKGAFTGATSASKGFFGQAHTGSLFLDEIGELPRELQGLLLRATREGEIQPVGEARPEKVDVRLLTATDADLPALVEQGAFSMPLLRRIEAFTLHVPPLRERRDDIPRLFVHLLRKELENTGELSKLAPPPAGRKPWLSTRLLSALLAHPWPGNVAELQTVARHIAISNRGLDRFQWSDWLEARLQRPADRLTGAPKPAAAHLVSPQKSARELSDEDIVAAMTQSRFKIVRAAELLGVSRSWLHTRVEFCAGLRQAKELEVEQILLAADQEQGHIERMAERLEVSEHGLKLRITALGVSLDRVNRDD